MQTEKKILRYTLIISNNIYLYMIRKKTSKETFNLIRNLKNIISEQLQKGPARTG